MLFRSQVQREASLLYRSADRTSRRSEWPALQGDLSELARPWPGPPGQGNARRAETLARMTRTYTIFKR